MIYEKTLDKEQKANWPLHLSSLVFAYNAMPHSITGYMAYQLMFGHKSPNVCDACLWLAKYNDQYLQSKTTWVNEQHDHTLAVKRQALKTSGKQPRRQHSVWDMLKDNLVLLGDHPKGRHEIQDNYKAELFMVVLKHQDPNVHIICPL